MRRPEVTAGGRGSKGTALRLTVILGLLAVELRLDEVNEDQVDVGAAGDELDTSLLRIVRTQTLRKNLRALKGAALTILELLGLRDLHGDSLRGNHMHEGAALLAGEHGRVELLAPLLAA